MSNRMRWFALVCLLFSLTTLTYANNKKILLINSYHKGFQWSDDVISGIEKVLYSHKDIDVNILYMDSKRIASNEYFQQLRDLYKLQLENQKYDLVLAVDKFAYEFVVKHYAELFTDEEIFFTGIEQFDQAFVAKYRVLDRVSGILEKRGISDSVKMIDHMIPSLKKLYIINDKSANGDDSELFVRQAIKEIGNKFEVEYIRHTTLEALSQRFSVARKGEAVLFIRFYNNKDGHLNKNSEIASMIDGSQLPVFVTDTLFIGKGAFGGKLVPIETLGEETGELVLELLQNKMDKPFITVSDTYEYIFDYDKVKAFRLPVSQLEVDYRYVNGPLSFFEKHRDMINFVFMLSPLFVLFIAGLVYTLFLRSVSERQLRQRMEFDKVLLDAIESPIVWQDENGKVVDSNAKFGDMMQLPCPENQGKTLQEYVDKKETVSLLHSLASFVHHLDGSHELTLKDEQHNEKIYLINQTKYTEDIYQTSGVVTIFTDITKEKKALAEKTKNQEFIIQQSKLAEIGEIFSSIAHQWKSPLVEIATLAQEQLYNTSGDVDEENNEFVNDIMVQVQYMTDTINDFQEFIMPSSKKVVFNIKEAIVRMMEIVRHNMKYNYIDVSIDVAKDANLMVLGYKNELMQTMLNIVNNAKEAIIKAKLEKRIERGKVAISIFNCADHVFIEIEDNAGGIDKEALPKIFDPYFTTKDKGHGIGLYMAQTIIENKMNGKLSVINARYGAKFCIELEIYHENLGA